MDLQPRGAPRQGCGQRRHEACRALGAERRQNRGHPCGLSLEPGEPRGRQSDRVPREGGRDTGGCASRSQVTPITGPSTFPGGVFDTSLFLRLKSPAKGSLAIYIHTQSAIVSSLPPTTNPTEGTDSRAQTGRATGSRSLSGPAGARKPGTCRPRTWLEFTLENIPESAVWEREPLGTAGATG